MSYRVHKSKDGCRVAILGTDNQFVASLVDGEWLADLPFDAYELEDLLMVNDSHEADALYQQARAALANKKSVVA